MIRSLLIAVIGVAFLAIAVADVEHVTVLSAEPHKDGMVTVIGRLEGSDRAVMLVVRDANGKAFTPPKPGSEIRVMRLAQPEPNSKNIPQR